MTKQTPCFKQWDEGGDGHGANSDIPTNHGQGHGINIYIYIYIYMPATHTRQ